MKIQYVAGVAIVAALVSGCAQRQFVKGHGLAPSETVYVVTDPVGATVSTNYGQECLSPCYLPLLRDRGGEVTVAMEGYHTERWSVTSSVSSRRVAFQQADIALEAIDPDPVSIALTTLGHALSGKGGVMSLDERDFEIKLRPLAEGEEDLLADAEPLTGERIPIDLSEDVASR